MMHGNAYFTLTHPFLYKHIFILSMSLNTPANRP